MEHTGLPVPFPGGEPGRPSHRGGDHLGRGQLQGNVVIGTGGADRNIFVMSGDGGIVTGQFSIDRRVTGIGFEFQRALQTFYVGEEQFLIFKDVDGFYLYDGSSNPRRISDDVYNTIQNLIGPDTDLGIQYRQHPGRVVARKPLPHDQQ